MKEECKGWSGWGCNLDRMRRDEGEEWVWLNINIREA